MNNRLLAALALSASAAASQPFVYTYPEEFMDRQTGEQMLRERVEAVTPWLVTPSAQALADAVDSLPPRIRRWRWGVPSLDERTYTIEQYERLSEEEKRPLSLYGIPELIYYGGWQNDAPFVELRALDVAFVGTPLAEPSGLAGAKVLLVEPRVITHAWLLARLGAHVTVVTPSQRFHALYDAPSDRGAVRGIDGGPDGSVTIINADWPSGENATQAVGGGFDLIVAINAFIEGRLDPTPLAARFREPLEPSKAGGSDRAALAASIADALAPGGRFFAHHWGPADLRDTRASIDAEAAAQAGLSTIAIASDASVFSRILGDREGRQDLRRRIDAQGLTTPQISVIYAIYQRPETEN